MQAISPPSPRSHKWICFKHSWTFTDVQQLFNHNTSSPTVSAATTDEYHHHHHQQQIVSSPLLTPTNEKFQINIRINLNEWINHNYRILLDISVDDNETDDILDKFNPDFKYSWMVFDNHGNPYNIRDWGLVPYGNQFTIITTIHYKTRHGFWFDKYDNLNNYRIRFLSNQINDNNYYDNYDVDDDKINENDHSVDCIVFIDDYFHSKSSLITNDQHEQQQISKSKTNNQLNNEHIKINQTNNSEHNENYDDFGTDAGDSNLNDFIK